MATHPSILAWKIPWKEEPGRLQAMGSQRVGHDWVTSLSLSCPRNRFKNREWIWGPLQTQEEKEGGASLTRAPGQWKNADETLLCQRLPLWLRGYLCGSEVNVSASNAGDLGLIPGSGRSPGEGNGKLLQYSCPENSMNRKVWWAAVHDGLKSSQTRISD